jgi:hypothetical protein
MTAPTTPAPQDGRAYPLGPQAIVDDLEKEGLLKYGTDIPTDFFEKRLLKDRHHDFFPLSISAVRDLLIPRGFYLNGYGGKGNSYRIEDNDRNAHAAKARVRMARKEIWRAATLAAHTDRTGLTEAQIAELDQVQRRAATIGVLMDKPAAIEKLIKKYQPKLLGR